MWDKTTLKSVKNLYKEEVLQIPAIFKNKDDYVAFLMAQSYQESGWNEESVSKTGCKGFAQFELSTWKFVWKKLLKHEEIPSIWDIKAQIIAQHTYMKYLINAVSKKEPMLPRQEILASSLMAYNGGLSVVEWCLEYHGVVSVIALRDYRNSHKSTYPDENKIFEILNYPISIFNIWRSLREIAV
jgi:hypothetical protein